MITQKLYYIVLFKCMVINVHKVDVPQKAVVSEEAHGAVSRHEVGSETSVRKGRRAEG